jgi:3-dehydroquinate dehydratase / shikimate dehydrogenase
VQTRFLQLARAKGIATIPGYEMFVQQGARQFEIWSGKPAPVEEMRGVVMKALGDVPAPEHTPLPPRIEAPKPEPPKPVAAPSNNGSGATAKKGAVPKAVAQKAIAPVKKIPPVKAPAKKPTPPAKGKKVVARKR